MKETIVCAGNYVTLERDEDGRLYLEVLGRGYWHTVELNHAEALALAQGIVTAAADETQSGSVPKGESPVAGGHAPRRMPSMTERDKIVAYLRAEAQHHFAMRDHHAVAVLNFVADGIEHGLHLTFKPEPTIPFETWRDKPSAC